MFSFLKSFVGVKSKQLGQDLVQAIVEIDPESATQAQLEQMEKDLDNAGVILQKIRADYEREVREAEAAEKRYNQMLAAAEHLQDKAASPSTPEGDKAGLEASLGKLLEQLEQFAPEVAQERQDVVDVKALLDETQAAYKAKAEMLATAKQKLDRARHDMQRAVMQQDRAEEQARRQAEVSGLRATGTNKLNVAVDAMQRRADEARAKAESARMKTQVLSNVASGVPDGDANIAEALKAVQGGASKGSAADRLAALKKK